MAKLDNSRSLASLSIPGTHDSLSILGGDLTQTQENYGQSADSVVAQLNAGIRFIDVRLRIVSPNKLVAHHGAVYLNANFGMPSQCYSFHACPKLRLP